MAKKVEHKQQRQSYNKFSKDFKNGPCLKKGNFKKFVSSLLLSFIGFLGIFLFVYFLILFPSVFDEPWKNQSALGLFVCMPLVLSWSYRL